MENVQALLDRSAGAVVKLPPGEHQGPLVVRRSCTVEGTDATLWAAAGPVLVLEAPQVTVRGLRVEVIGRGTAKQAQTAIQVCAQGCRLENVEAAGLVTGLSGEAEDWSLPRMIDLGSFAAGEDNSYLLELWLPQGAVVENLMNGVTVSPLQLAAGLNRLELHTGEISDNTILYGELLLKTAQVARRLYVKGEAVAGAAVQSMAKPRSMEPRTIVPQGAGNGAPQPPQPPQPLGRRIDTTRPPRRAKTAPVPQPVPQAGKVLVRGQRLGLRQTSFTLRYQDSGRPRGVDLNCFVFCLGADGKAKGDEDLIFFNHTESADSAIRISQTAENVPQVAVDLGKAAARTERYVISLALYEPPAGVTLGSMQAPRLTLEAGGEVVFTLPLDGLHRELIVNAVELYRYKGEWRLSFVGAGYEAGLARLCNDYGIQVE